MYKTDFHVIVLQSTSGRSCVDHIQQIMEKYNAKLKQIGLVFVDLKKAYDSVPRQVLQKAPEMKSISELYCIY
jgi:polysaccharide deacetylase 2 family uncharacterized protein YibQ